MSATKNTGFAIEDPERGQASSGCCSCTDSSDPPDSVHVLLLRIIGSFTLVFGGIEIGLGVGIFNFLDNEKLGAWWVGVITVIAGLCAIAAFNRSWVKATCVFSLAACATAAVGAALDGISSLVFQRLSACSSKNITSSQIYNYGSSSDYQYSNACLAAASNYVPNLCYCVTAGGSSCGVFTLSGTAKSYNQDCGNILSTYANSLTASTAFCVMCFVNVAILFVLSSVMLCCVNRSVFGGTRNRGMSRGSPPDVGVSGAAGKNATH